MIQLIVLTALVSNNHKMSEVSIETGAYAKIILHAAKYPHCAVNGVLLADAGKTKEGGRNQSLDIVDAIPLFHHSHYVSPMAEVALTQVSYLELKSKLPMGTFSYFILLYHLQNKCVYSLHNST